jgi:hypothetical protein
MPSAFSNSNATTQPISPQEKSIIPSGYSNSFDVGIARQLGVNAAIVYNHIIYWIKTNFHKGHNFIDGKTWMYETISSMSQYFGYLSEKQIKSSIKSLVDANLLIEGYHSKNKFDRTTWYCLVNEEIFGIKKIFSMSTKGTHAGLPNVPIQNDKMSPCITQDNNQEDNTKEEQQQPAAPAVVFFKCLEGLDLTNDVKERLCKSSEEEVEQAVLWATHPDTEIKTTLAQALTWAIKEKPKIPLNKQATEEENRKYALSLAGKIASKFAGYHCGPQYIEVYPLSGMSLPECINYDEKSFKEQLNHALHKQKFYYIKE